MTDNKGKYIIGLCIVLSFFLSAIFYIRRSDDLNNEKNYYNSKKLALEELKNEINEYSHTLSSLDVKKSVYGDLNEYLAISFTKKEVINLIYELAVKNNLEIVKMSSSIPKFKYNIYTLKYVSIMFRGDYISIYSLIEELSKSARHFDFKDYSLSSNDNNFVLTFGYIEREDDK